MIALPRLAGRIFGVPLAIERGKLDVIVAAVAPRLLGGSLAMWDGDDDPPPKAKTSNITQDGIAVIDIQGTLVSKSTGMDAASGLTTYAQIATDFLSAVANPSVRGILLNIDSPGGEVQGMFDLADAMLAARGSKPICAFAGSAFSAAYLLASTADWIVVPRDAGVGSVGVMMLHLDESGADQKAGLKYTAIFAGDRKNDGSPHEPLTDSARARMQERVDTVYGLFVASVSRGRGMTAEAIKKTQALTYTGQAGVDVVFADSVGTQSNALASVKHAVRTNKKTISAAAAAQLGERMMAAIAKHHTATSDAPWDPAENVKRLPSEQKPLEGAHAWVDPAGNADSKASYKFPHHNVSDDGKVGAANLAGATAGIEALNGAEGKAMPAADRQGVHDHLAAHLKDAGKEVPELMDLDGSAAAAAPPLHAGTAIDLNAIRAAARDEVRADIDLIVDMCAIAGKPALAAKFIVEKTTAADVSKQLLAAKVAENGPELDSSVMPGADAHKPGKGAAPKGKAKPWKEIIAGVCGRKEKQN